MEVIVKSSYASPSNFLREAHFLWVLLALLLLCPVTSFAETDEEQEAADKKKVMQFGSYQEKILDLEVKVQGGVIRIWRTWEGDIKRWSINPQHDSTEDSEEQETDEYGQLVSKEISRGLRKFKHKGAGAYEVVGGGKGGGGSGGGSGGNTAVDAAMDSVSDLGFDIDACTVSDTGGEEMVVNSAGRKWISGMNREWAQFDNAGAMLSWGVGNNLIGKILRSPDGRQSGYADSNNEEVVTYTRNQFNEIRFIEDYTGAKVEYKYNVEGRIEEVIDADGVKTRYSYDTNGNIIGKIVGDKDGTGADPANLAGEEVAYTLTYLSNGQLQSIKDGNGEGSDFSYLYDPKTKNFTKSEKASGNVDTVTTTNVDTGLQSMVRNDTPQLRVVRLCEDSVILDRSNRATYFDRDRLGRLQRITFPDGKEATFEHTLDFWPEKGKPWDSPGKPWGVKAFVNLIKTRYDYIRDPQGNILEATETTAEGESRKWKFTYDSKNNRESYRLIVGEDFVPDDLEDFQGKWVYDNQGNPARYINARFATWHFRYNSRGDLTEITEPKFGSKWLFQYTSKGQIKNSKDPAGLETFYKYNNRGLLKEYREIYEAGKDAIWKYDYNSRGRVTKITDPFGANWIFEYDGAARLIRATDPDGHSQSWTYDRQDRVKSATDGNGVTITYDYYDTAPPGAPEQYNIPFGPITRINYPTFTEERHHDLRNRVVAQILRPQSGDPLTYRFKYDDEGRVTEVERPDGEKASFKYNGSGWLTEETLPGWGTSTTQYLKNGKEVRYNHPNGEQSIQRFDVLGLLASEQRADGNSMNYEYDFVGNLERFVNSNGQVHKFFYEPGDRMIRTEAFASGAASTPTSVTSSDYNLRGDIVSYSNGSTSTNYALDKIGRTLTSTTNYGPFAKSHAYSYRANGLPATYTDPSNVQYRYLWDNADQFQSLIIPDEGAISYSYDSTNWVQPKRVTLPGGVTQDYEYDGLRRIKRILSKRPSGETILDYNYLFTNTDLISEKQTEHGTYKYEYDSGYRLTEVDAPGDSNDEEFIYDSFGNRSPAEGEEWTYDENGAVLSDGIATYEYDNQGNRTKKTDPTGSTNYFYDEGDRLVRVEKPLGTVVASYGYDAFGVRLWKEINGVKQYFYYTDEGLAAEFDEDGNEIRSYAFEPGSEWTTSPLLMRDSDGYKYFHNDHLGTPQKVTDASGTTRWAATYAAFGKANVTNSGVENPLRFPGQYADAESGLHQNLMRDYDPGVGAYTTQDPYGLITGANRYGYAYGDPVQLYDPTGEVVPAFVIGYQVLLAVGVLATGFEVADCVGSLFDDCMFPSGAESCRNLMVSGALTIAGYGVFKGVKLVGMGVYRAYQNFRIGRKLVNATPISRALKSDHYHRSATFMRSLAAKNGKHFQIRGGDGEVRTLTQIPGQLNGKEGRFEFIVDKNGNLTHQVFIEGGSINGVPNIP